MNEYTDFDLRLFSLLDKLRAAQVEQQSNVELQQPKDYNDGYLQLQQPRENLFGFRL